MRNLFYLCFPLLLVACATTSTIHTQPLGAEVHINGQRCGVSPCIHHERYGFPDRMRVQIKSPGYESAEFFVDTEPPVASFLLYGFGSYFLHGFAKEYRFSLYPLKATTVADSITTAVGGGRPFTVAELTNIVEQCLYWREQKFDDVWDRRFIEAAMSIDCKMAEQAIISLREKEINPSPQLARALIRYMDYRRRNNLPALQFLLSLDVLCNTAKVEYAKRIGAGQVPPVLPGFDKLCPVEAKQLRNQ